VTEPAKVIGEGNGGGNGNSNSNRQQQQQRRTGLPLIKGTTRKRNWHRLNRKRFNHEEHGEKSFRNFISPCLWGYRFSTTTNTTRRKISCFCFPPCPPRGHRFSRVLSVLSVANRFQNFRCGAARFYSPSTKSMRPLSRSARTRRARSRSPIR
jgi:hypothetical protein